MLWSEVIMQSAAGVHHVGFGVRDLTQAKAFYCGTLSFSAVLEEWPESINAMADTYRNAAHAFSGFMCMQPAGGLIIEPICMKWPTPRPIRRNLRFGDIGVNKLTLAVADVGRIHAEYQGRIAFIGDPQSVELPGLGRYEFVYARGPEGNLVELASWAGVAAGEELFCGAQTVGLSVTDLERSKAFYQHHCGFDLVVTEHEVFSGRAGEAAGGRSTVVKSCILDSSRRKTGRGGMLELYEVSAPRGRSIPFGAQWGDYGYMEICLFCRENIIDVYQYALRQGLDVVQRPTCMGENESGTVEYWFLYVRDPDGILVEFVGYHSRRESET
jgi:catechol 2,3-dioxygenase-like lactoylglutathione lyase family enzyme